MAHFAKKVTGYSSASLGIVAAGFIIISEFNLFKGSSVNRLANLSFGYTKCIVDKMSLPDTISGNRSVTYEEMNDILKNDLRRFLPSHPEARQIEFHSSISYIFKSGHYRRPHQEPVVNNMYITSGKAACLFPIKYANVMSFYTNNKRELYYVTYSKNSDKIFVVKL